MQPAHGDAKSMSRTGRGAGIARPYIITYIWARSMGKQNHPFQETVLLSDWLQLHTHRRREFSAQ